MCEYSEAYSFLRLSGEVFALSRNFSLFLINKGEPHKRLFVHSSTFSLFFSPFKRPPKVFVKAFRWNSGWQVLPANVSLAFIFFLLLGPTVKL